VDDINPEFLPDIMERFIKSGALDIFVSPVLMKKGRQGYLITALCEEPHLEKIEEVFFRETPTIGIRKYSVERNELERKIESFTFSLGTVDVKKSYYHGDLVNFKAEHGDIIRISNDKLLPVKKVVSCFYDEFKIEKNQ